MRAEPWVLLPGMLQDERLWSALELPTGTQTPSLVGDTVDRAVDAVLRAAPSRFRLGGLSLGGIVAMALVARAPERVSELLLLSTNARAPTTAQRAGWDELERRCAAGGFEQITPEVLWPLLVAPHRRADPELAGLATAMATRTGPGVFADQLALQRSRPDLRPGLVRYAGPATVVAAEQDALCSPAMHSEIVDALPAARLVVLPDTGHLSPLEAPDQITPLLCNSTR